MTGAVSKRDAGSARPARTRTMHGAVLYGPGDVRFEEREAPTILEPTDAIIRISATCVCGSDLWPYRGVQPIDGPTPMGHEYCGIVEEIGSAVKNIEPGQTVVLQVRNPDGSLSNEFSFTRPL